MIFSKNINYMDNDNSIFNSFTYGLSQSMSYIEEDDESYRWRFSKKRKYDEISHIIDEHSIIYDSDTESEYDDDYDYLSGNYITNEFRVWRSNYIKKYKCNK